jgi:predicted peptidase
MTAQEKPQDKFQRAEHFQTQITKTIDTDYLVFLPKDYDAKSNTKHPLMLVLHGAGERGTNVWRADIHGPSKYIAKHPEFPFIMISPICPAGDGYWSNDVVLALLDNCIKKYNADPERIYVTGLSMGGYGTWSLAIAHPGKFAAAIPICGGGETIKVHLGRLGYLKPETKAALKTLPIWAFHGSKDSAVPVDESEHMVKAFRALGNENVKLTIYPGVEHNSWEQTYNNPEIYDWLLSHKRPAK